MFALEWKFKLFLVLALNRNAFAILTEGEVMMLFYLIPSKFLYLGNRGKHKR